jgi:hypothetical protein
VVYRSPENPAIKEAHKAVVAEDIRLRTQRAERREKRVLLNEHTYPELYAKWQAAATNGGSRKLPKCRRCDGVIHWGEPAHVCPGFQPKYAEHDQEWHERQDARREEIREAKHQRETPTCKLCGAELPTLDDYWAHGNECSGL